MVGPLDGTPITVPCTLVFPLRTNTESVVVPRVFAPATPSTWVSDRMMASVSPPTTVRSAKWVSS